MTLKANRKKAYVDKWNHPTEPVQPWPGVNTVAPCTLKLCRRRNMEERWRLVISVFYVVFFCLPWCPRKHPNNTAEPDNTLTFCSRLPCTCSSCLWAGLGWVLTCLVGIMREAINRPGNSIDVLLPQWSPDLHATRGTIHRETRHSHPGFWDLARLVSIHAVCVQAPPCLAALEGRYLTISPAAYLVHVQNGIPVLPGNLQVGGGLHDFILVRILLLACEFCLFPLVPNYS